MSGPLTFKERNRDEVWCAARERVRARISSELNASVAKRLPVDDRWIIDELHAEALAMVDAIPKTVTR